MSTNYVIPQHEEHKNNYIINIVTESYGTMMTDMSWPGPACRCDEMKTAHKRISLIETHIVPVSVRIFTR